MDEPCIDPNIKSVQSLECGCLIVKYHNPPESQSYTPCLACALHNAGLMLQEAAKHLRNK